MDKKPLFKVDHSTNRVSLHKLNDVNAWNLDLLKVLFNEEETNAVLQMVWSQIEKEDELLWMANPDGCFFVKSCFKLLDEEVSMEGNRKV